MKKYIVKAVYEKLYLSFEFQWDEDIRFAYRFDEIEEAENHIENDSDGIYMIETIYVVD
jgi:hypothetical protein